MGTYLKTIYENAILMKIIGRKILNNLKQKHSDVRSQVDAWEAEAASSVWRKPLDIKERYSSVSFLPDNCVVFNLKGNKYRLKTLVNYKNQIVLIMKAGTHDEYMNW